MKEVLFVPDAFLDRFDENEMQQKILAWILGVDSEISFWNRWFETKGLQWPDDYAQRVGGRALTFPYSDLLKGVENPRVLDVGAGPISRLGNIANGRQIELVACDPLAFAYECFTKRAGVQPYVSTEFALSERLRDIYLDNSFDVVHMSNALDHAINPFLGLYNMLSVCKIGGSVVLYHRENEAQFEQYQGLHQWNICENSGALIFSDARLAINITDSLKDIAQVNIERRDDPEGYGSMILAVLVKKNNFVFSASYMNLYDKAMSQAFFYLLSSAYRASVKDEKNFAALQDVFAPRKNKYPTWVEAVFPVGSPQRRVAVAIKSFLER